MPKFLTCDMCASSNAMSETARRCPDCGRFTHPWEDVGKLTGAAPGDLCATWDGVYVMSLKFKDALDDAGVIGIEYKQVARTRFAVRPVDHVHLDISQALYQAKDFCLRCGRFATFQGGGTLIQLLEGQRPVGPMEIVRGVPGFGNGAFVVDQLIAGDALANQMKGKGHRGVQWLEFPAQVDPATLVYPPKRVIGVPE